MQTWPERFVSLDLIQPHPDNPRRHPDRQKEALAASIGEFGLLAYPIWNEVTGHLVDGHARLELAQSRGESEVWCIVVAWDEATETRALLAFDKIGSLAESDDRRLLDLLSQFDRAEDTDLLARLYPPAEDQDILARLQAQTAPTRKAKPEQGGDEYIAQVNAASVPTRTQVGDLWQLGPHHLAVGDCTDAALVSRLFHGLRADFCFTSPPYNIGKAGALTSNRFMQQTESRYGQADDAKAENVYLDLLNDFLTLTLRFCPLVAVNLQTLAENKVVIQEWLYKWRYHLKDRMVWHKGDGAWSVPAMAEGVLNSMFEDIYFFTDSEMPTRAFCEAPFLRGTVSNIFLGDIQRHNDAFREIAATFPLHLPTRILETFTRPDQLIYDPFLGSGTTLIACERLNRIALGCEINPRFADLTLSRWEAETGEIATKEDG